jgi:hypothetical protein
LNSFFVKSFSISFFAASLAVNIFAESVLFMVSQMYVALSHPDHTITLFSALLLYFLSIVAISHRRICDPFGRGIAVLRKSRDFLFFPSIL